MQPLMSVYAIRPFDSIFSFNFENVLNTLKDAHKGEKHTQITQNSLVYTKTTQVTFKIDSKDREVNVVPEV